MSLRQRFFRGSVLLLFTCLLPIPCIAQTTTISGTPHNAVRDLLISDHDNDWSFQQLYALTVDARGNIYAWDSEDYKIRTYDAFGKPLTMLSRKGQGPGELSQLGHFTISDDTLWVSEHFSNRISAFSLKSKGFRTTVVVPKSGGMVTAKLLNGFLVSVETASLNVSGFRTEVIDRAGNVRATLASFRPVRRVLTYDVVQENVKGGPVVGRQVVPQPFLTDAGFSIFPDGTGFIMASVSGVGAENVVVLKSMTETGTPLWETRTPFQPIPFTDQHFQKKVDELVAPTVVNGMRIVGNRKMIIDSLARPKYWPAFTQVVLGIDRSIWLKAGSPNTDESIYWQFSPTGVFERIVRVPGRVRILAASQKRLWGTRQDAEGNPIIERYVVQ